ncbi:ACR3 family arsenite efflux transporter [Clostridium bowmanii]|nr:ACR3 family arsenite efflux transporter [Clostridium bowmanii]
MVVSVLIGKFIPVIPEFLNQFEYAKVSIPTAILIWVMIYPMMMKVDFQSIKNVRKEPKGLYITWITNWLIKPFTMYVISSFFFFVVFKAFIAPELATQYLAGTILLGAAPCTAMVFVWSTLTKGNPAYTVVQVATNDLIILVAFIPIVKLLLGVSSIVVPWSTLILSVVLFVVIPLAAGILTRIMMTKKRGLEYFENTFLHKFDNATTVGLLLILVLLFSFQGEIILNNPLHILLISVPLTIQTFLIFFIAYLACRKLKLTHDIAAPAGMIGASNFFELSVAVAIALGLSAKGKKVHLTTTDPAAHLKFVINESSNITMSHIDEQVELEKYKQEVLLKARETMADEDIEYVEEDLRSPCTQEIAVFRAFAEIGDKSEEQIVVIDTAPTGHTLLLFDSTQSYNKKIKRYQGDIPESTKKLLPRLRNADETEVIIVTLAEATPVYEAMRLEEDLIRAKISTKWWVINSSL